MAFTTAGTLVIKEHQPQAMLNIKVMSHDRVTNTVIILTSVAIQRCGGAARHSELVSVR